MPFSNEQRKCPRCCGDEIWDMMIQVNGKFYCRKCYIAIFGNKEDKKKGMCSAQSFNKLF